MTKRLQIHYRKQIIKCLGKVGHPLPWWMERLVLINNVLDTKNGILILLALTSIAFLYEFATTFYKLVTFGGHDENN
jgi:hypothetical protein